MPCAASPEKNSGLRSLDKVSFDEAEQALKIVVGLIEGQGFFLWNSPQLDRVVKQANLSKFHVFLLNQTCRLRA
jgi:hypothetical protein